MRTDKNVQGCFFVFSNFLSFLDPSFRLGQKLAIKMEVDTCPPQGAVEVVSPVTGKRVYKVRHYDLPSLFAGKLHALLYRSFTKGRDLYDFLWYVGKKIHVNKTLLERASEQSQKEEISLDESVLRNLLAERFQKMDFEKARKDLRPFLSDPSSLSLFEKSIFTHAVGQVFIQTP